MKKTICVGLVFLLLIYIIPLSTLITRRKNEKYQGEKINVYDAEKREIFTVDLEEYVLNTVAKEMPLSFEEDALKAQAVAVRTYTLKKREAKNKTHPEADICTDSNHCMAYSFGEIDSKYRGKLEKAVSETKGEVLLYNNQLASTVFHAISSGKTENATDIWGGNISYLTSVDSEGDKTVEGYETKVEVSYDEFIEKINGTDYDKVIGKEERTPSGTVKSIILCGKELTGSKVRELFNLRSANFKITEKEDAFEFTVYGYGHGVGMSQYGANNLAKKGFSYEEILSHYYPGTVLKKAV